MSDDFYPFVDSGDPAPDNAHITGIRASGADPADADGTAPSAEQATYATRIAVYDDMLSTPRVIVIAPKDVRSYLEEITNTVYRCMREQGGGISLMVIREIVENFIHANFVEPIISILDDGNTIRFADQGPGIEDKERAFEFGVTSADRDQKRYIRGTGAGFPMVQQYLENAGGAVSIEDNLHQGTVVTVSIDPARVMEIEHAAERGGAVRGAQPLQAIPQQQMPGAPGVANPMAPNAGAPLSYQAGYVPYPQGYGFGAPGAQAPAAYPAPQGYAAYQPQGYPPPAYQQPYQAPWPQQPVPPNQGWAPQASMGAGGWPQEAPHAGEPYVSERGALALSFLAQHGSGGPTDLAGAFGSSAPTWSRELETLAQVGLVIKRGQKRFLTEMGQLWAQNHQQNQQNA